MRRDAQVEDELTSEDAAMRTPPALLAGSGGFAHVAVGANQSRAPRRARAA
jgi:hypothetical protein